MNSAATANKKKRVLFTMGSKGGTGKTLFACGTAEWCLARQIPFRLLDFDTENQVRGSLSHYFPRLAKKVEMHSRGGLDELFDFPAGAPSLIIADQGAASGNVTFSWFEKRFAIAEEQGIEFTAVGIITPDPTSVESVLSWATTLQHQARYWIVKNSISPEADFSFWERTDAARQFRNYFAPDVLELPFRVPAIEHVMRQHGVTLTDIATRKTKLTELQRSAVVMRVQAYRRHLFSQLDSLSKGWT